MKYTSFRTYGGCYQWKRLPMGLKAAPAHFQQQMASTVLGPYLYEICEIYLDDVIIYGETEEDFLRNVETILKRFREFNILINPAKCTFGASKIQYTGHILSEEELYSDAKRVDNVLNFPKATKQQELKSFLGFAMYFHQHIKNYSMTVAPLHNMLVVSNWRVFLKKPIGIFVFYFKYTIISRGPVAHSFYIYKYESSFENNKCND
jgi:hypothetical protein